MTAIDEAVLARAAEFADTVLFPAAPAVDRADRVPASHLDRLAELGLYGLAGPVETGGLGVEFGTACRVAETLAGGCLATAFVWLQHQGVVRRLDGRPDVQRELCSGARRAGVALGGVLPGPPRLRATRVDGGWRLDGESPWVTGWGMVDTLLTAARTADDELVWALVGAREGRGLGVRRQELVAVNASGTVTAGFDGLAVPDERVTGVQPYAEFAERDAVGLRFNGSLALGVIERCRRLLGESGLDDAAAAVRAGLDAATTPQAQASARAAASALALRISAALVARSGSGAVLLSAHPQRLAREALFLAVFASRPTIKTDLLTHLTGWG